MVHQKWYNTEEAATVTGMKLSTMRQLLAKGRVHPRMCRKMCNRWKLRRDIVDEYGIILDNEEYPNEKFAG